MQQAKREETAAFQQQDSFLTFKAGDIHFAIAASHVRYITANCEAKRVVHRPDGKQISVFEFEKQSVSCFDFNQIIGVAPHTKTCAELMATLKLRRQEHIDWLDDLEVSLTKNQPFTRATNPHECTFGKWYDTYKTDDEDLSRILAAFDEPHQHLHSLAGTLLSMEDRKVAIDILYKEHSVTLHRLLDLFDDANNRLEEMQRVIAIILETNGHLFAIELSQIKDLVTFTKNQLDNTRDICQELPMKTDIVQSFYHQENGPLYFVIDINKLLLTLH